MRLRDVVPVLCLVAAPAVSSAQHYQTDFPPEEFQARWAKVFDAIGAEAVAVVQGAPLTNGFTFPRQSNEFYYLCGIETPGSYLVLDGRVAPGHAVTCRRATSGSNAAEGKVLSADDAELVKTLTGVDEVRSSTRPMTRRAGALGGGAPAVPST